MILMEFIGLLLVALALFGNLKAYPNVFAGKKKKAENEEKFNEAFEKIEETGLGEQMTDGMFRVSLGLTVLSSFLFYLITSVVVANPIMYALAVIIFLLNFVVTKTGMKALKEKKYAVSKANKLALPLKTVYIVGFFILFFL
jgi:hypothetical protein